VLDYSHQDTKRDGLGRIISKQENIGLPPDGATTETFSHEYVYDGEGRLIEVYVNGATTPTYEYTYDANGNRTSYSGPDRTVPSTATTTPTTDC
jgi:YD repeat-containing protein